MTANLYLSSYISCAYKVISRSHSRGWLIYIRLLLLIFHQFWFLLFDNFVGGIFRFVILFRFDYVLMGKRRGCMLIQLGEKFANRVPCALDLSQQLSSFKSLFMELALSDALLDVDLLNCEDNFYGPEQNRAQMSEES